MEPGKARHLSRRLGVRLGIPGNIALPKFLTPPEIKKIAELKSQFPNRSWDDVIFEVVQTTAFPADYAHYR